MSFRQIIYSGICICGHSYEDHHCGMVMNADASKEYEQRGEPPVVPQECEFFGFHEMGGLDADGNDHCHRYVDREDPGTGAEL